MRTGLNSLLAAAVILSSCSVKEDRDGCPCRLEVDFTAFGPLGGTPDLVIRSEGYAPVDGVRTENSWSGDVRKGIYTVSVVRAGRQADIGTDEIRFPEGVEPDSLYAFAREADCRGEKVRISAQVRKQFCSVTLREKEKTLLQYAVRSRHGALSRAGLAPLPAPLAFPARRNADGDVCFRLPRQGPDSHLLLEVSEGEGEFWSLPLGEWMEKAGYDWTLPSLADFRMEIDYTASEVRIRILDWTEGETMTLTI